MVLVFQVYIPPSIRSDIYRQRQITFKKKGSNLILKWWIYTSHRPKAAEGLYGMHMATLGEGKYLSVPITVQRVGFVAVARCKHDEARCKHARRVFQPTRCLLSGATRDDSKAKLGGLRLWWRKGNDGRADQNRKKQNNFKEIGQTNCFVFLCTPPTMDSGIVSCSVRIGQRKRM